MKCLSICQPWATLVVLGAKRFETRSWQTHHRGPLAIHASKTFKEEARELCREEPFRSALLAAGYRATADLPRGCVLGMVELAGCLPTATIIRDGLADVRELAFGDFRPGRHAFDCRSPRRLLRPLPWTGQLSLFEIPEILELAAPADRFGRGAATPG